MKSLMADLSTVPHEARMWATLKILVLAAGAALEVGGIDPAVVASPELVDCNFDGSKWADWWGMFVLTRV